MSVVSPVEAGRKVRGPDSGPVRGFPLETPPVMTRGPHTGAGRHDSPREGALRPGHLPRHDRPGRRRQEFVRRPAKSAKGRLEDSCSEGPHRGASTPWRPPPGQARSRNAPVRRHRFAGDSDSDEAPTAPRHPTPPRSAPARRRALGMPFRADNHGRSAKPPDPQAEGNTANLRRSIGMGTAKRHRLPSRERGFGSPAPPEAPGQRRGAGVPPRAAATAVRRGGPERRFTTAGDRDGGPTTGRTRSRRRAGGPAPRGAGNRCRRR